MRMSDRKRNIYTEKDDLMEISLNSKFLSDYTNFTSNKRLNR